MPFQVHPDITAAFKQIAAHAPPKAPIGDVATRRKTGEEIFKSLSKTMPDHADVETEDFYTTSADGQQILCRWFTKKESRPGSAVLYAHGGGMIAMSVTLFDKIIKNYVSRSGVSILAVAYRLAPEFKAPTQVQDLYAGLQYLVFHSETLGVDTARIGIMGESAGGGLVASLAHYIKDQCSGHPHVKKQILIYPMLDDRTVTARPGTEEYLLWTVDDNKTGWSALLDGRETSNIGPIHAAGRMNVADAVGLPEVYIDIGELDLFASEACEYAAKLGMAGVSCELHHWPGVPHGFEGLAPKADVSNFAMNGRVLALQSI